MGVFLSCKPNKAKFSLSNKMLFFFDIIRHEIKLKEKEKEKGHKHVFYDFLKNVDLYKNQYHYCNFVKFPFEKLIHL